MGKLEQASDHLMGLIGEITDMRAAPLKPPESMSFFPFSIVYPLRGAFTSNSYGEWKNLAVLRLEVHVGRTDLPLDIATVYPFLEGVADVVFDPDNVTLGGNVDTVLTEEGMPWGFGELGYGSDPVTQTIGFTFDIQVKVRKQVAATS